jgi:anti-sigma regulatory factor (Ser/Thr protein kinase)
MPAMTMTKPATKAQLAVFLGFVDLISERYGLDRDHAHRLKLVLEEAIVNVVEHGYATRREPGDLTLTADVEGGVAMVTLQDHGTPFGPDDAPPPDLDSDWDQRRVGGLGWHLIRELTDAVAYHPGDAAGGRPNILTLRVRSAHPNGAGPEGAPRGGAA